MSEEVGDDPSAGIGTTCQRGTNPAVLNPVGIADSTAYNVGQGAPTSTFEQDNDHPKLATQFGQATETKT